LGRRYLVSNLDALVLKDSYGYTINPPSGLHNAYTVFDSTTGKLSVRGGSAGDNVYTGQSNPSNDTISISLITSLFHGMPVTYYKVSESIGNYVPGTGPNSTLTSVFAASQVKQISIQPGDGSNVVNILNTLSTTTVNIFSTSSDTVNVGGG